MDDSFSAGTADYIISEDTMYSFEFVKKELDKIGVAYLENVLMSAHTTFRIGGPTALYVRPGSQEELVAAARVIQMAEIPMTTIGKGSNLLVSDDGYPGAILSTECVTDISIVRNTVTCSCGASVTGAAVAARDSGLSGMEFLYGIPGSAAGAVFMNAGAYGGEIADILSSSIYYDMETGVVSELAAVDHAFDYRNSVYRSHARRIILSATFVLTPGQDAEIRSVMDDYMHRRKSKQPLEFPSAGSVFKRYPGRYTGQMIEECGLKGKSVGGAQVSEKHAGFIINRGGATASDVLRLIEIIKEAILNKFGVEIECEMIYLA